jgi:hypothetical protein
MEKILLQVPTPCHENWDTMTATQQGRFCNACSKQVVDFTNMSDADVLRFFAARTEERTCGRVMSNQLDREMQPLTPAPSRKNKIWQFIAMFLLFFSRPGESKAQQKVGIMVANPVKKSQPAKKPQPPVDIQGEMVAVSEKKITGVVRDQAGKPVASAKIFFPQSERFAVTDEHGVFSLNIYSNTTSIVVHANGYESVSINIGTKKFYQVALKALLPQPPKTPHVIMGKMAVRNN